MKRYTPKLVVVTLGLFIAAACDRIGGRRVEVEFRTAEGISGGEAVYLAGVRIGTTGEPTLVGGRARVPVNLDRKHKNSLAAGAVFLIKADPADARKLSLTAAACGNGGRIKQSEELYKGASNRLEFIALCGAEQAKQLFEELTR